MILRIIFDQPGHLRLDRLAPAASSELLRVECGRSLDRARLLHAAGDRDWQAAQGDLVKALEPLQLQALEPRILARAAEPLAVPLGTLDAIHFATALGWREYAGEAVASATHDTALARAARLYDFAVVGA